MRVTVTLVNDLLHAHNLRNLSKVMSIPIPIVPTWVS